MLKNGKVTAKIEYIPFNYNDREFDNVPSVIPRLKEHIEESIINIYNLCEHLLPKTSMDAKA